MEKIKIDFSADTPIVEQAEIGLDLLQKHCQEVIESAKKKRQIRIEQARKAHFEWIRAEEEARRLKVEEEARERAEVSSLCASNIGNIVYVFV